MPAFSHLTEPDDVHIILSEGTVCCCSELTAEGQLLSYAMPCSLNYDFIYDSNLFVV